MSQESSKGNASQINNGHNVHVTQIMYNQSMASLTILVGISPSISSSPSLARVPFLHASMIYSCHRITIWTLARLPGAFHGKIKYLKRYGGDLPLEDSITPLSQISETIIVSVWFLFVQISQIVMLNSQDTELAGTFAMQWRFIMVGLPDKSQSSVNLSPR